MSDDGRRLMYEMVANRRTNFDAMLWQVPVLTLTAQAFLFTIALSGDSSRVARIIACLLAIVASWLAVTLMARHRQAEIVDAHWLERREQEWFGIARAADQAHGPKWAERRNELTDRKVLGFRHGKPLSYGGFTVPTPPAFGVWVGGFLLFGLAAALILVLSIVAPGVLESPSERTVVITEHRGDDVPAPVERSGHGASSSDN